jgi:hypothetical protein
MIHKFIALIASATLGAVTSGAVFAQTPPSAPPWWPKGVPYPPQLPGTTTPAPATPAASAPTAPAAPGAAQAPPAANAASTDILAVPPPVNATQLFQQGSANGEQLKYVLEAIKLAALQSKSRASVTSAVTPGPPNIMWRVLAQQIREYARDQAMAATVSYSDKILSNYIQQISQDDNVWRAHTVLLPKEGATMQPNQQQRLLAMAAMVVAAKISRTTLAKAKENFAGIETEYAALLERRQKAAEFLATVLEKRRQAAAAHHELEARNLQGDLSAEDLKFIDSFGPNVTLETFTNDVGLQNLAIKYLKASAEPGHEKDYDEYTAQKTEWVGRSKAYLQTMAGVSAFGGFSVLFVKEFTDVVQHKDLTEIRAALPLVAAFLAEAGPLMSLSGDSLYAGFVLAPNEARKTYRLEHAGVQTEVNNAPDVYRALAEGDDKHYLDDALFRNGAPGFISHVYQCDVEEAGNLLDAAIPKADRERFAANFMQVQQGGFTFADALQDDASAPNSRHLADLMLNRDQRVTAENIEIGEIQRLAVSHDDSWGNTQLTRLVLANSEGPYAQMQLGNTVIRLVPSMATIYAYESYADACFKAAAPEPESPKPAPRPGVKNRPRN